MRLTRLLVLPAVALLGSGLMLAGSSSALAAGPGLDVAAFSCPHPDGLFPYPGDMTRYVQCSNNVPTVQRCPDGPNWNPTGQYCDWPASAGAVAGARQR